jgi:hypothetical protein
MGVPSLIIQVMTMTINVETEHQILGYPIFRQTYSGWWLSQPSEKYEFVSWDYYSQYIEKMFQTTNQ